MGVQIVAKGVDAEQFATEYAAPVRRGLEGIFFTNTSLEKIARNYAPDKLGASVVGSPTVSAGFATFKGMTNYLQTQIQESVEMSIVLIAKSTSTPGPSNATPMFFGTYDTTVPVGISMYAGASDRMSGTAAFGVDAASSANAAAVITPIALSTWTLYSLIISNAGITERSHTQNLENVRPSTNPRQISGRTLRIGGGYSGAQSGPCDIALLQCHSVALTDGELAATVANLRAYAARRGITV